MTGRGRNERGALSIEAALAIPLLVFILFGFVEFGLAWRSSNQAAATVRAAVLEASRDPEQRTVDLHVIERIRAGLPGGALDEVEWVIVYRTDDPQGDPTAACSAAAAAVGGGTGGVVGSCNVYGGTALATLGAADFTGADCVGSPDEPFCPIGRRSVFGPGDRLGVALRFRHDWITGLLPGGGRTISDHSVTVLEPDPAA